MPGHGGRLHGGSWVYERRDRAEVGLGKWRVVMEEELEVESE